mgnify:CR=1 FL=1
MGDEGMPTYIDDGPGFNLVGLADDGDFPIHIYITKDRRIFQSVQGELTQVTSQAYINLLMQQ